MKSKLRHKAMRACSWLPLKLLLWIDHKDWWSRDDIGFSFWTDAHYWQYCRKDRRLHGHEYWD